MANINNYLRSLFKKRAKITNSSTLMYLQQAKIFFKKQKLCVPEINLDKFENLIVIGDMHGQISNLKHILKQNELQVNFKQFN